MNMKSVKNMVLLIAFVLAMGSYTQSMEAQQQKKAFGMSSANIKRIKEPCTSPNFKIFY